MNCIDRFLSWAHKHYIIVIVILVSSIVHTALFFRTTKHLAQNTMIAQIISTSTQNTMIVQKNSTRSGAQRLYPIVREGDDSYLKGDYQIAWDYYADARSALRELQTAFPDRSAQYRDAERVVQNRMYLAEIADSLKHLMPNHANAADAKKPRG